MCGDLIPRTKKKGKAAAKKPAADHICRHCGKHLKTEKGLAGHEKRCSERGPDEKEVTIASETEKMLGIEPKPGKDVKVSEELERELARLKEQYNQQKAAEQRLAEERQKLAAERDELYKGMSAGKTGAAAAVLDPFGDGLDDGADLPAISGPVAADTREVPAASEPEPPAPEPPEPQKVPPKPATPKKVDLAARTAELKRKLGRERAAEPEADEANVSASPPGMDMAPAPGPDTTGIPQDEIVERIRRQVEAGLKDRIYGLESRLSELTDKVIEKSVLESMMRSRITQDEFDDMLADLKKELQKMDTRMNELGEEVGFGESLNVSKIPPTILESVYEATLADAVKALIQSMGPYDAEALILKILEDIRTQTSGSELFKFESGKLRIINLARSLESKLISARQIQSTYSEVLKRIKEHVPGFKPKNFRAMLKIKSQEFAVDKASGLSEYLDSIRADLEGFKKARVDIETRIKDLEETRNTLLSDVRELEQRLEEYHPAYPEDSDEGEEDPGGSGDEDEGDDE